MRPLWITCGWFLAGALYTAVTTARLRAVPWSAILLAAIAGGVSLALPSLAAVPLAWRREKKAPSGEAAVETVCKGMGRASVVLLVATALTFVVLRRVAAGLGLGPQDGALWYLVAIVVVGALAIAAVKGSDVAGRALAARRVPVGAVPALVAALVLLAALGGGVGRTVERIDSAEIGSHGQLAPKPRRVVIAVDGLGEEMFATYRGVMPNLSAFADRASRGTLVHEQGGAILSVPIWNAIATGLPVEKQRLSMYELYVADPRWRTIQVTSFFTDPAVALLAYPVLVAWRTERLHVLPATRFHRKGTPFWDAPTAGRAAVVCWTATWPAEPLNGVMVTDRWPPDKNDSLFHYRILDGQVFPPELAEPLAPLRRSVKEPADPEVIAMAPLLPEEIAAFNTSEQGGIPSIPKLEPFNTAHYAWLGDRSCLAAGRWALENVKPDLFVLYLKGVDNLAHAFLPNAEGGLEGFDEESSKRVSGLFANYLARLDRDLGELLAAGGEGATTIFLADHSLEPTTNNLLFGYWHTGPGMVLAQGPGYGPEAPLGNRGASEWHELLVK